MAKDGSKRRIKKKGRDAQKTAQPAVERAWRGALVPRVLAVVACVYFASIWLDTAGSSLPPRVLPKTLFYFTAVACLFPHSAVAVIDYRAEGWFCGSHSWAEIETAQDFPIDSDNKENRFYRALHFLKGHRQGSQALDEYLVTRHNARASAEERIGGVRLLSLREPLPEQGKPVAPYVRHPLGTYPADRRKDWYFTPASKRAERCGDRAPRGKAEP